MASPYRVIFKGAHYTLGALDIHNPDARFQRNPSLPSHYLAQRIILDFIKYSSQPSQNHAPYSRTVCNRACGWQIPFLEHGTIVPHCSFRIAEFPFGCYS
jgi:hypothetical protein